jgi:TP901 family phage tail tape measure protein
MSVASSGRDVSITLTAVDNMSGVLRTASGALGEYRTALERTVSAITSLGPAAIPILAIGAAFAYTGQQAAQVQQNVANLNSVLHATADQLTAIRNNGLALSQATQFTDAQILQAQRQLAKGGATADALAVGGGYGVTGATLNLAGATQTSPTEAATAITTATKAFDLGAGDASRTATILAQAVDTSVGSLSSQAAALKQVGVVAQAAGYDLRGTTTAIADLQNAGMQGDAGTGLKTFLARIESPSATARKEIDALGLSFYDLQGHLKPIPQLFDEIRNKTQGMTDQAANNALFNIFGQRGVRVADIAREQGGAGFNEQAARQAEMGDAADINARKLDTFSGSASKAASSLNVLAVQAGTALLPAMKGGADAVTFMANALSSLNNNAAALPQIAVAAAALGGLTLLQNRMQDRRAAPAEAAAKEATERNAQALAMRQQAQGEADRALRGAGEQRQLAGIDTIAAQQVATDEARIASTAKWAKAETAYDMEVRASQNEMVLAMRNADSEYVSQRMSNLAKLRAAVRDLQQAEHQRLADAIAMQDIQMRQEAEALQIRQRFAHERLDLTARQGGALLGADPQAHIDLSERQDLERREQEALAANRTAAQAERATITGGISQRAIDQTRADYANQRNALLDEYRKNRAAIEVGAGEEQDAMRIAHEKKLAEMKREEAEAIRAIEGKSAAEIEAQRIAFERQAASIQSTAVDKFIAADSLAAGRGVRGGTAIAPAFGNITVAEAERQSIGSRIGGALGRLVVPVLIAVTAKELVVDPLMKAVIEREVGLDKNIADIHIQTRAIIDSKSGDHGDLEQRIAAERIRITDEIRRQEDIIKNDPEQTQTKKIPIFGNLLPDDAATGTAKRQIASLKQDLSDLDIAKNKVDLLPAQAVQTTSDRLNTVIGKVDSGNVSLDKAKEQWLGLTVGMESTRDILQRAGVSQDEINQKVAEGTVLIEQHVKALQEKNQQEEADFQANAADAMRMVQMGGNKDLIAVSQFGTHLSGQTASKSEIQQAKEDLKELEQAWTKAGQTVNQIDITKGFNAFGNMSDQIRIANQELERVGQSNTALQGLGRMSAMFKEVLDAEKLATQGLEGYNLTLSKTQGYIGEVDRVQKDFDTAIDAATRRQAAGRATAADETLLANRGSLNAKLDDQRQQLSEHMVLDVLGEVQNLPDFAKLDQYVRDVVEKAGGGLKVVATVQADTQTAKDEIENILKPRDLHITVIGEFQQFDSAMNERIARYSNAMGNDRNNIAPVPPGSAGSGPGGYTGYGNQPAGSYAGIDNPYPYQAGAGRGGPLGYRGMSYDDYQKMVESGTGGQPSPMDNPATYAAVMSAAQEKNVDPRLMLTATRFENQNATNISPELLKANNYAGISFDNQPGATQGPYNARDKDYYAAFANPEDFFKALAKNLSEGAYQKDYESGNVEAIRHRYTPDEGPAADKTFASSYEQSTKDYPATSGAPTRSQYGGGGDPRSTTDSGATSYYGDTEGTANTTRQKIVNLALSQVGIDKLVAYCEQFVEETVAAITGKRGATGKNEADATTAFIHGQAQGLETRDPQPGDLVYYPDPGGGAGHTAIYIGKTSQGVPQQVSTWDKGSQTGANRQIHQEDVGPNARYLSIGDPRQVSGEVGDTVNAFFNPADPGARRAGTSAAGNGVPGAPGATREPIPVRIYPDDAAKYLSGYGSQMANLDPRGQGEMSKFEQTMLPVLTSLAQESMGFGPTGTKGKPGQADIENIQNAGLSRDLQLATAYGAAVENINKHLAVTPEQWDAINKAAGPLAGMIDAEVTATANLETHTEKLRQLKEAQAEADTAHETLVEQRQIDDRKDQRNQTEQQWRRTAQDEQITAQRRVITEGEQDFDRARQRRNTLEQRDIQDARTTEQRQWQDEETARQNLIRLKQEEARQSDIADQTHKNNLDDAYQVQTRAFEDAKRIMDFRGGQESIGLQDARKALDEQHRVSTEGMQQNSRLFVGLGKAAGTEAEATNFAGVAADINDARLKADDLYKKMADANTRAQDALSKTHAQEMYNLETERITAQRQHDDEVKGIDRAAQARHNALANEMYDMQVVQEAEQLAHRDVMRNEEDLDKRRSRSFEDESFAIETTRLAEQRRWQDDDLARKRSREDEDISYQKKKWQQQDLATDQDNTYKNNKLQNQQQQNDEQANITAIGKQITGIDEVIARYDTLLKMFGNAANQVLRPPAVDPNPVAPGTSKGFAVGTSSSPAGLAFVNERGGELRVLGSGETIIPADQTKRMFDAMLRPQNVTPISAAPSYHEGNITINMGGEDVALSAAAQSRIRAIIRQEVADSQPTTYSDVRAAAGAMRRA